jgi:restriction system protein
MPSEHETAAIHRRIQQMDAYDFEQFIADLWARQGWDTTVSQASIDAGIDVTATKETPYPQKQLIQAKRYGPDTTVSGPEIQQYASLKQQEDGVDSVVVVTSNRFTTHAIDRANELNVKTVDGNDLVTLIERLNAHGLLDDYVPTETTGDNHAATATNGELHPSQMDTASRTDMSLPTLRSTISDLSWSTIPPDTYFGFILLGTGVWSLGLLLALIGYSGGTFGTIVGIATINCWIMLPPALYYEAQRVSDATDWTPSRTLYALGGAVPFLNAAVGGIYIYRRQQAYQRIDQPAPGMELLTSPTEGSSPPQDDTE